MNYRAAKQATRILFSSVLATITILCAIYVITILPITWKLVCAIALVLVMAWLAIYEHFNGRL